MHTTFDNPSTVPAPAGLFSHVARVELGTGALLFVSGQVALDDQGQVVGTTMAEQTRFVLENLRGILESHGAGLEHVVNLRGFVVDMDQRTEHGAVRAEFFPEPYPSSTLVEVSRLFHPDVLIELEAVAAVPSD